MADVRHPRVVVLRGGQVLAEHPLPPGTELVLGRSDGCGVTIADSSVSRLHARLVAGEDGVYVEDLGSANGTFLDGERLRQRTRLSDGQQVRVAQKAQTAPLVLRFEDGRVPAAWSDPPPAPLAATVAIADPPATLATPPPAAAARGGKRVILVLVGLAALGAVLVAVIGGWALLRWQATRAASSPPPAAEAASMPVLPTPSKATPAMPLGPAPAPAAAPDVLVVPATADATTPAAVAGEPSPDPSAAADSTTVTGKWTARLENLFYPEDDYVIELRLDLRQRGTAVTGRGEVRIENRSMTFGVPAVDAGGSVRPGSPPQLRLVLPFGRPIGELRLEGALEGGALAGTFRSSLVKQPGSWQAVRAAG